MFNKTDYDKMNEIAEQKKKYIKEKTEEAIERDKKRCIDEFGKIPDVMYYPDYESTYSSEFDRLLIAKLFNEFNISLPTTRK